MLFRESTIITLKCSLYDNVVPLSYFMYKVMDIKICFINTYL